MKKTKIKPIIGFVPYNPYWKDFLLHLFCKKAKHARDAIRGRNKWSVSKKVGWRIVKVRISEVK